MAMPNRHETNDYRYAYQGQEKDPETGKEAFELRLWDSRIGRWLTTDPYGQYHSPHLGMGNNSISETDPDDGFWQELGNWIGGDGWISNVGLDYVSSHGIENYETHFSNNPLNSQGKLGKHTISYTDGDGALAFHQFKNVDDFNHTAEGGFEVSFGLQVGFDLGRIEGIDLNRINETLLSYDFSTSEWFWSGKNGENRIKHSIGGSIGGWGVAAQIEHRHKDGKVTSSDWSIEGGYTSFCQIGVSNSFIKEKASNSIYSKHGVSAGAKLLLGINFSAGAKIEKTK